MHNVKICLWWLSFACQMLVRFLYLLLTYWIYHLLHVLCDVWNKNATSHPTFYPGSPCALWCKSFCLLSGWAAAVFLRREMTIKMHDWDWKRRGELVETFAPRQTFSPLNQDTNQHCGVRYCHMHINFVLWSVCRKCSTREPHTASHVIYKVFMAYHLHLLDLKCPGKQTV